MALENARLFDETKRLLAETDERAAELAIINSVQEGLAQNLDMQAMYDLVGDKIQEIFDAQVVDIGIIDNDAGTHALPVHDRARGAIPGRADSDRRVAHVASTCWRRASRCSSTTSRPGSERTSWAARAIQGERPKSVAAGAAHRGRRGARA